MHRLIITISISTFLLLSAVINAEPAEPNSADIDPEAATGFTGIKRKHSQQYIAVTANPHATKAAYSILSQGGSAADAAIAAQLVLGLVEPQSSGIGGGAFLMHWSAKKSQLQLFDGRETAPSTVDENYYLNPDQKPKKFFDTLIGGYSVGNPGVVAMLGQTHQQHGKLPWSKLFAPAIKLAGNGFSLSPRLYSLLHRFKKLLNHPTSRAYFYLPNGEAKPVGTLLKNPDYAVTLRQLAKQGANSFYHGSIATDIINAIRNDTVNPGKLSLQDINNYQPITREALCGPYREYTVCTTPPPSSGTTVLQILGIIEQMQPTKTNTIDADWVHVFAEASKLAFADRDTYIADPDFVNVPVTAMIEKSYIKQRAALIDRQQASAPATPGKPVLKLARNQSSSPEFPSTSHLSIVDAEGNAVSMTSSVQMAFGSGIMVGGFLLNNQLTDFSYVPRDGQQHLIANRIQAGKRPRSSMSPTIVFKQGQPVMLIGSPGGARIIDYVAQTLVYTLDSHLDIAEAIASPHIVHMNRKLELETGRFDRAIIDELISRGHTVKENDQNSGLHGIWIDEAGLTGGADPRREGISLGL